MLVLAAQAGANSGDDGNDAVAIVAVIISALAVIVTALLWHLERRGRQEERAEDQQTASDESIKRAQLEGQVAELQRSQNEILDRMAEALRAAIDPAERHKLGADISLFLVRPDQSGYGPVWLVLVVKNLGPGGARVTHLEPSGATASSWSGGPLYWNPAAALPIELLPGEEHYSELQVNAQAKWPLEIFVSWIDGTGAERQRVRSLASPP